MICPSCGLDMNNHLGIIGTCAELQAAKILLVKYETALQEIAESITIRAQEGTITTYIHGTHEKCAEIARAALKSTGGINAEQ